MKSSSKLFPWHQDPRFLGPAMVVCLCLFGTGLALANGSYGDQGRITDITMTQDQVQDRADAAWAMKQAADQTLEDHTHCVVADSSVGYAQCMHKRQLTRMFYLLKRGCLGVRAASCS